MLCMFVEMEYFTYPMELTCWKTGLLCIQFTLPTCSPTAITNYSSPLHIMPALHPITRIGVFAQGQILCISPNGL